MKYAYFYGLNDKPVVKSEGLSIDELVSLSKSGVIAEHAVDTKDEFFSVFKDGELMFHKRNIGLLDFLNKVKEFRA
jgi:hypothetical protein